MAPVILKRLNVVKIVENELKVQQLKALGFEEVKEERDPKTNSKQKNSDGESSK